MARQWGFRLQRWLAAVLVGAIVLSIHAAPVDARSYDPARLDASFLAEIQAAPDREFDVIVRVADVWDGKKNRDAKRDLADRAGKLAKLVGGKARHALSIVGGASARVRGKYILALSKLPGIDYIYKDVAFRATEDPAPPPVTVVTPDSTTTTTTTTTPTTTTTYTTTTVPATETNAGVKAIKAPQVWTDLNVKGRGVGVAVIDSGVFPHPDLAGRIVASIDFTQVTPVVSTVSSVGDPGGHGTHVAGLVAGNGTSSAGAFTGVAPEANIIDVRVIDANGISNTSIILRALQWVMNNRRTYNIRVANMSFGATPSGSYKEDVMATAAEVLMFAGVAVVVSAGNHGTPETITSPATDPYVISVGAIDDNATSTLADDSMATFSSRGRTPFDLKSKPDLVAPGRRMVSLLSPGSTLANLYPDRLVTAPGALLPEYFKLSGTSMSAPMVSGTIALMLERNPTLSTQQIKNRIKKGTTHLSFGGSLDRGTGMVDALKTVSSIDMAKEYSTDRVTSAFAKDMRRFIEGQPFVWKDLTYNGGHDSQNVLWENVTWENVTWDSVTWDNVTWENFTWENVTWENVTWENVTWESAGTLAYDALAGNGNGWILVD